MAITAANRGSGGNATAATSISITPGSNFTSGSWGILCISYDNSGGGGADPFTTITDSVGNTWTSRVNVLNDPGAASAGIALRIFTTSFNIAALTTANTITVNFGSSTTAKAWTLSEALAGTGFTLALGTATGTAQTTASPTITTVSLTSGNFVLGVLGSEGNGTRTADADTTNGTWSTALSAGFGTTTGGAEIISQYKIVTATATQTFNPTLATSTDNAIAYIQLIEAGSSFDPMGMMGFFGM